MDQQSEGAEKRRVSLNRMQRIAVAGFLILIAVLVYALVKNHSVYTSYEVVNTLSRGDNTSVYYQIMDRGMIRYSKDGVAMTDKRGSIIWNQTYEMAAPILASGGQYLAIGDMGANSIYVFNQYGQIGRITTDVPIQEIKISNQGVTAAILSDVDCNYINLYDKQGKELGSIRASLENTGYPLAISLSPDATRLVVSYLCIDGGTVQTSVVFYDFSDMEENHIMETLKLDGLYPKVVFLNDTKAVLYGEKGFSLYNVSDSVSEVQNTTFEDEIKSVFDGNQKIGFILKNQDENGRYRMEVFDLAGKKNTTVYFDFDYKNAVAEKDEIILYNTDEMMIYQYSGRLRLHSMLNTSVTGIMASWEEGMYWLVDDQSLREIRIE